MAADDRLQKFIDFALEIDKEKCIQADTSYKSWQE